MLITVFAPLGEELFFRGFFFGSLRNWRGPWLAAVLTGLVFGAIHAGSSPVGYLVPLAIFGIGLCLLYEWTGSLYPRDRAARAEQLGRARGEPVLGVADPGDDGGLDAAPRSLCARLLARVLGDGARRGAARLGASAFRLIGDGRRRGMG